MQGCTAAFYIIMYEKSSLVKYQNARATQLIVPEFLNFITKLVLSSCCAVLQRNLLKQLKADLQHVRSWSLYPMKPIGLGLSLRNARRFNMSTAEVCRNGNMRPLPYSSDCNGDEAPRAALKPSTSVPYKYGEGIPEHSVEIDV